MVYSNVTIYQRVGRDAMVSSLTFRGGLSSGASLLLLLRNVSPDSVFVPVAGICHSPGAWSFGRLASCLSAIGSALHPPGSGREESTILLAALRSVSWKV